MCLLLSNVIQIAWEFKLLNHLNTICCHWRRGRSREAPCVFDEFEWQCMGVTCFYCKGKMPQCHVWIWLPLFDSCIWLNISHVFVLVMFGFLEISHVSRINSSNNKLLLCRAWITCLLYFFFSAFCDIDKAE